MALKKTRNKEVTNNIQQKLVEPEIMDDLNHVLSLKSDKQYRAAEEKLLLMQKSHPKSIVITRELVKLYLETQNLEKAESVLQSELKLSPEDPSLWLTLADINNRVGNLEKEKEALENCFKRQKDEVIARKLFEVRKAANDLPGSLEIVQYLRNVRDTAELQIAECKLLSLLDKNDDAIKLCDGLLKTNLENRNVVDLYATLWLNKKNNPQEVIKKLLPLVKVHPKNALLLQAIGRSFHRMEKNVEAEKYFLSAIEIDPTHPSWWYDISLIQRQLGKLDKSQKSLEKSLDVDRLNPVALRVYGVEHKYEYGDTALNKLFYAQANEDKLSDENRVELYFALAKAFEDLDELETAFKYYENAGKLQGKLTPYYHEGTVSLLSLTRDRVGQATYQKFEPERCDNNKPVFVLGMPRSGTTLIEQVLASHPDIHGAGELKLLHKVLDGISINQKGIQTKSYVEGGNVHSFIPGLTIGDCRSLNFKERGDLYVRAIEALSELSGRRDAKRVVDKMPGNYFWTGVIPFVLPNAKVIHSQRHPLDNCLSIYRIFFPDGMPWSYDLKNLGKVYRTYYEHMNYWESNLPPGTMLTINYEVMVADFENQSKSIISHLDLPWDENCLKFYDNNRTVKTASLSQVRKKVYSTSVGRWKRYEDFLKPLIQELNPIIKDYDAKIEGLLKNANKN